MNKEAIEVLEEKLDSLLRKERTDKEDEKCYQNSIDKIQKMKKERDNKIQSLRTTIEMLCE